MSYFVFFVFRWEDESSKFNQTKGKEELEKLALTKDNINALLEQSNDLYSGYDSMCGLGLRASLPKMPSFRRKKIPSPSPVEDEESKDLSDQEEIVRDDEEADDSDARKAEPTLPRSRKGSSSSSSSSSGFSSDDESSSSDESSSDESDREVMQINR